MDEHPDRRMMAVAAWATTAADDTTQSLEAGATLAPGPAHRCITCARRSGREITVGETPDNGATAKQQPCCQFN
jgi:hypothetical protein